ncbi:hypothetical protein HDV00_007687 [Rhizophlyctis rosea]|nr:hypothetical protein HDV00_007687 [Rhizophlyctis rosea]
MLGQSYSSLVLALVAFLAASASAKGFRNPNDPLAKAPECQHFGEKMNTYIKAEACPNLQTDTSGFLACRCSKDFQALADGHLECIMNSSALDKATKTNFQRTHNIYACVCDQPKENWNEKEFRACFAKFPKEDEKPAVKKEEVKKEPKKVEEKKTEATKEAEKETKVEAPESTVEETEEEAVVEEVEAKDEL